MVRLFSLVCLLLLLWGMPLVADEAWQPLAPEPGAWDWLRLNSGEWLGGHLELMRAGDLEFDSDELGMLKLDWDDVSELHSPRILTYRFEGIGNFTGTAVMRGDTVTVNTFMGVSQMPRHRLILIMEGKLTEKNFWSARASLGMVGRSGNTNQTDVNSNLRVRRLTPGTRSILEYTNNYGKVQDIETINNHNLSVDFDVMVTARFFVTPLKVNLFRDPFQNLQLKSTWSAGVGYDIVKGGDLEWSIGVSGGYQGTTHESVEEGEDLKVSNGTIIANTEVDWDITGDLECRFDYNAQIGVPDVSNAFHHAQLAFSFDILGDILDLDLSVIWDRVESPTPDADGFVSERDDFRTTIGIGFEL